MYCFVIVLYLYLMTWGFSLIREYTRGKVEWFWETCQYCVVHTIRLQPFHYTLCTIVCCHH
uniref:Uncharacterized protein n=1 Tax=Anguilla anguilla TaxID=7936 RepID=A0A0E9XKJ3_ANGAN